MMVAAGIVKTVVDCAVDIAVSGLSEGLLMPFTMPRTVSEFADAVTAFIGLARDVGRVVDGTFPPGDPLSPMLGKDEPLVLPDMIGIEGWADIPALAPVPSVPVTVRTGRAAA
jgi:hypothetical protein